MPCRPALWCSRLGLALALFCLALASSAAAGPRDQARRIHDRLVGTPPSEAVVDEMVRRIMASDALGAADYAMLDTTFYSSTLKTWVTPWTNEERTVFAPLNDYSATVIGLIRDERPFTEVLSADTVYVAAPGLVSSAYSHTNNDHYEEIEAAGVDLGDPAELVPVAQSSLPGSQLQSSEAAGVITTRAAGEAFFSAGTNRRMWRFTAINYLCRDMEDLKDITRPAGRVRQDVTRSPGGDSSIFLNSCIGCHSGMDPMAQAFAYFEWDENQERVVHTPGIVQGKYLINANTFPHGFITTSNRWDNYWREGPNAVLGWRGASSGGFGARSLGIEVASSRAFSQCQVEKVFEQVCFREPANPTERQEVQRITDVFETENHNLKRVFAETAVYCMGN
jgi:hypothetical protein